MNEVQKKNKELIEKYPFLRWWGDPLYASYAEEGEPSLDFTWENEIPAGWRRAFCPVMWDELKAILEKADYVNEFRFLQIKEKYGSLRLYCGSVPEKIFDEIVKWERKYEQESMDVCIRCGKHHIDYMTTGWITFICKECAKEIAREQLRAHGNYEHFVKQENIELFFDDRDAYWAGHRSEDILKD